MDLSVERASDVPLGTQLAWKLRAAVAAGALRPGDRLPAVRELAAAAGVNVNTARAVYARLAEQGVVVSEHGRGTFVTGAHTRGAGLAELVERVARDAHSHGVDPRELAAVLYARFDTPPAPAAPDADEADARRALRSEIEALEEQLGHLEPLPPAPEPEVVAGGVTGARLMSRQELEAMRDELSRRVAERQRELRAARAAARRKAIEPRGRDEPSAWPELLAVRPAT
jgi:DNA-binding transcriptional regulator YhcF (GntR family)